jgi:hypothetical protein
MIVNYDRKTATVQVTEHKFELQFFKKETMNVKTTLKSNYCEDLQTTGQTR